MRATSSGTGYGQTMNPITQPRLNKLPSVSRPWLDFILIKKLMERGQIKAKINHIPNHQNTNRILNICTGLDLLICTGFLSLKGWAFIFRSRLSTIIYLYFHLPRGLCQDRSHVVPAHTSYCLSLPDKGSNSAWSPHRTACCTGAPDITTSTLGLYYSLNGVRCFHVDEISFAYAQELHQSLEATVQDYTFLKEKGCCNHRQSP